MYILTAAQSYQAALEASRLGHGYLTYALIEEGLKNGQADADPADGTIFAREWFNYATRRVPQMQEERLNGQKGIEEQGGEVIFVEGDEKIPDPASVACKRPAFSTVVKRKPIRW